MSKTQINITTPVGRIVGGSLYDAKTTDSKGAPLVFKSGPNVGQPRTEYSIGVAFPKTPGVTHWAQEAWLQPVWNMAHAAFPAGEAKHRDFSWKITDGDSIEPNKKQKRPCDQEGYKGHWVIWFTDASKAPRVCDAKGTALILERNVVKPGYYVQVSGVVDDNKPSESPGLYWQPSFVAFAGHGVEINFGPSLAEAGFGNAALPAGASPVPLGGMAVPGVPALPAPAMPAATVKVMTAKAGALKYEDFVKPGSPWTDTLLISEGYMEASAATPLPLQSAVGFVPTPGTPAPIAPVPVIANPAMAAIPVPGAAAAIPSPGPVARTMTAAAGGYTYEQLIATGKWTDALLIQNGLMLA
jgi:hypothetical protein